ncbi:hypothetical protein [Spirulina sp. 06S082]|uniref:hypothetical protein n=1 Tax=Spirulina sp. 06S082 TaxID=3110248 RepID=UPI002B2044FD|nr:hypothetical protein [Spirulina sp. 06S082]MEA5471134.1 hypothetical protein [Spirulina sp. 06S082]
MLDIERSPNKLQPSSLSQWLYQAIQEPGVRLRIRLRGNNLHILCEGSQTPEQELLKTRLVSALKTKAVSFQRFFRNTEDPIYKIVLYGRSIGKQRPDWIESIVLDRIQTPPPAADSQLPTPDSPTPPALPISNEDLARGGTPEAIARYLSESLSHLGVAVKVLIQKLPDDGDRFSFKRLWVICSCHYSPDASLIAEPIAQQLRDLELEGFKEAIIRAQVQGEETPDWMLQVDLTRRSVMLREWARWGDIQSIECLLENCFQHRDIRINTVLKDKTLHIFSSWREDLPASEVAPAREEVVSAIAPLLQELSPQGIETAEIYGLKTPESEDFIPEDAALLNLEEFPDRPIWVHWLELPAAKDPQLALSTLLLAQQKHPEALNFLLQRLLNPDVEGRLATGGIRIKLCFKDRLLHIMTEAVVCPRQTLVAPKIEELLEKLKIDDLAGARIYGRRSGQSSPLWSYGIDFEEAKRFQAGTWQQTKPSSNPSSKPLFFPVSPPPDGSVVADASPASVAPLQGWQVWRSRLQTIFNATQFFAPLPSQEAKSSLTQTPVSYPSKTSFPAALTWLAIGCFLAIQIDWGLMRWLTQHNAISGAIANVEEFGDRGGGLEGLEEGLETKPLPGLETKPNESEEKEAQKAAMLAVARLSSSSFNNTLLDEKLALYRERVKRWGAPDILIVGSSRALRGIDPTVLQKEIGKRELGNGEEATGNSEDSPPIPGDRIDIFNFGINGATAQVVHLLLAQILNAEELPKRIIWADGARAFNSGRQDLTYEAIASSRGFRQLKQGKFPGSETPMEESWEFSLANLSENLTTGYQDINHWFGEALGEFSGVYAQRDRLKDALSIQFTARIPSVEDLNLDLDIWETTPSVFAREPIDTDGFLPLSVRFDPETYYLSHPKVAGIHDRDYSSFNILGSQYDAFHKLMSYLANQQVQVVFVNLPLTHEYLQDPVRSKYEEKFQEQMQIATEQYNFDFLNLAQRWQTDYDYFSDPSHLNRYGAYQVSVFLARESIFDDL